VAMITASAINKVSGGAIIAPWQIDYLPDEWIDAFNALTQDLPEMREGQNRVDAIKAKWRKNQGYGS
jgi:hypothetical protein